MGWLWFVKIITCSPWFHTRKRLGCVNRLLWTVVHFYWLVYSHLAVSSSTKPSCWFCADLHRWATQCLLHAPCIHVAVFGCSTHCQRPRSLICHLAVLCILITSRQYSLIQFVVNCWFKGSCQRPVAPLPHWQWPCILYALDKHQFEGTPHDMVHTTNHPLFLKPLSCPAFSCGWPNASISNQSLLGDCRCFCAMTDPSCPPYIVKCLDKSVMSIMKDEMETCYVVIFL